MSSGSEFQTTGPETRKLLGPKRRVLVRGTVRSPRTAESQMSPGIDLPDRVAGAAEVSRTSPMDGVADEDRDLEFNPLANGKPVELVPQHRSDMVKLPLVRDQPGSRVKDRLKSSHNNVCGTVKMLLQ